MNIQNPELIEQITGSIAEQIGLEPQSIELESDLEEDLGLLELDLKKLLSTLNRQFEELHLTFPDLETNEVHTVGDLIQLVDDELAYA